MKPGKERTMVRARSLLCYWVVRELGLPQTDLARMLHLSPEGISVSVKRGEALAEELAAYCWKLLRNGKLKGVRKALTQGRDKKQKVIVYLHHHPFLYPGEPPAHYVEEVIGHWLEDGDEFMDQISNRVDILLFGYEHWLLDFT